MEATRNGKLIQPKKCPLIFESVKLSAHFVVNDLGHNEPVPRLHHPSGPLGTLSRR